MKTKAILIIGALTVLAAVQLFALTQAHHRPSIFFPRDYDTNRAERILSVLRAEQFRFLGGLTSYWPDDWGTTLVYAGTPSHVESMISALEQIKGVNVRITYSDDLVKETGSALPAGSWWVTYGHTAPDTVAIRINRAATGFSTAQFGSKSEKK